MGESKKLKLASLSDGAAEMMFEAAMTDILENIDDPNTKADAVRTITLTITVKPNEQHTDAAIVMECTTKLAKTRPVGTVVLLGRSEGEFAAVEVLRQESLFGSPHGRPSGIVEGGAATTGGAS